MKKLVVHKLLVALSLVGAFALTPSVSQATNHGHKGKTTKKHIPEFDGRSTGAGLALVLGGVLVMVERRRRAKNDAKAIESEKPQG